MIRFSRSPITTTRAAHPRVERALDSPGAVGRRLFGSAPAVAIAEAPDERVADVRRARWERNCAAFLADLRKHLEE